MRREAEHHAQSGPAPALDRFTPEQVRFAVAAWPLRAAEELRSALIYRALARASRAVLPSPWPERLNAVFVEELGHARLCLRVGQRLGADAPAYDPWPVRHRLAALPHPAGRAAALLAVEVAMGETISAALFRAGRRSASEPLTRWALESIVSDEARHQQLGWAGLEVLLPRLTASERVTLEDEIARGLGAFERQSALPALRLLESGEPFDPAHGALGVLSPEARVEAFYQAVERLVIPRLDRLGVDGANAWARRYANEAGRASENAVTGDDPNRARSRDDDRR